MTTSSAHTVLFIGSHGPLRDAVELALSSLDLDLARAGEPGTALKLVADLNPSLLILDSEGSAGARDAVTTLRADPATLRQPLLVLCDRLDSALRTDLVQAGADGCLAPEAVEDALLPMATAMIRLARDRALHRTAAREAEWLLQIAQELYARDYPETALTSVASTIAAAVPLSSCSIIVLSPGGDTGYVATGAASLDPFRSGDPPSFELASYPHMLQVVQQRQRMVLDALPHDPFELTVSFDEESLGSGEAHGAALFPILGDSGEVVGILTLHLHALAPPLLEAQLPFFERAAEILATPLVALRARMRRAVERVSQSLGDTDTTLAEHDLLVNMVEHSPNAVVAADMAGNVLVFNRSAEKLFGYASDEVMGHMLADDLMLPGAGYELGQQLARGEGSDTGHVHDLQLEGLAASGEIIPVSVSAANLMEDGVPVATVRIYQDLRTRMALESRLQAMSAQLMESEKQATLAVLAGTTAHELNQPLTTIMGLVELLQFRAEGDEKLTMQLDKVYAETERMSAIVKRIGRITRFSTTSYVGETEILDLDKSSE